MPLHLIIFIQRCSQRSRAFTKKNAAIYRNFGLSFQQVLQGRLAFMTEEKSKLETVLI